MAISEPIHQATPFLGEATIRDLHDALHGTVIRPGDADYDNERKIFNGMIDRHPALIVRCLDTHDVVEAVRFARSHDLVVAVRGGGHSVAGHSVCEGGMVIDLSLMKGIEVDPVRRVARAQAGLRLGELVVATEEHGLVCPTGTVSNTGLAGLALGGGYGWLSGKHGLTLDNVLAAEVVTADSRVLRASADEHPDLYWAIRGGSGNFGVVTSFELQLHPLTQVLGGMVVHPFECAREVLRFYREISASAPDELTMYAFIVTLPDGNQAVAIALCYSGPVEEGERVIAPIRTFGPPVMDMIRPMKYSEMNTLIDAANPPGLHNYWKWNGLRGLSDEVINVIVEHAARVPSPLSAIMIDQLHGAARRVSPTATAFAHRDAPHGLVVISMWNDPAETERNVTWTREFAAATERFSTGGAYVNGEADERARSVYGANYDRLAAIKAVYDPTNLFRHNQNIPPAKAETV